MPTAVIQDKKLSACHQMKSEQTIHHKKLYQLYARIITPSKSIDDIYQAMKGLDTAEKYSLLFNHVRPPTTDHLPSTHSHGCDTKFRVEWLA